MKSAAEALRALKTHVVTEVSSHPSHVRRYKPQTPNIRIKNPADSRSPNLFLVFKNASNPIDKNPRAVNLRIIIDVSIVENIMIPIWQKIKIPAAKPINNTNVGDSPVINLTKIGNTLKDKILTEKKSKTGVKNKASFISLPSPSPPEDICPLDLIS